MQSRCEPGLPLRARAPVLAVYSDDQPALPSLHGALLTSGRLPILFSREQALSDRWRSAVNSSCSHLEPDDLQQVRGCGSWAALQDQLARHRGDEATRLEFDMLAPGLMKVKTFTDEWIQTVHASVDQSVMWGLTRLVVKVCNSVFSTYRCAIYLTLTPASAS